MIFLLDYYDCVFVVAFQLPVPPPPMLTNYEKDRVAQMQRNDKVIEEYGIKRLAVELTASTA